MLDEKKYALAKYRISQAEETLIAAKMCLDGRLFKDCINRSYYVAFYAAKAVLAIEGTDFKRHKDVIAYFNKNYVATGIFPREVGKRLGRVKMLREESDYSDFYIASEEEARKQYDTANYIVSEVKIFLHRQGIEL